MRVETLDDTELVMSVKEAARARASYHTEKITALSRLPQYTHNTLGTGWITYLRGRRDAYLSLLRAIETFEKMEFPE